MGAAFSSDDVNVYSANGEPQVIHSGTVSSNYFKILGVQPELGRFFPPDADDRDYGAHDEVVLSDALWRTRFGADPNLVGRMLSINRHPFTVIGIAPKGFLGIFGGLAEDLWIPVSSLRELSPDAPPDPLQTDGLQVAVRLRPGISDVTAVSSLFRFGVQLLELGISWRSQQFNLVLKGEGVCFGKCPIVAVGVGYLSESNASRV